MDGGRRVLRSLREPFSALFASARPLAGESAVLAAPFPVPSSAPIRFRPQASPTPSRLGPPRGRFHRIAALASLPGAGLLLTTDAAVAELPKEDAPMAGGGMPGGMGGMGMDM